MAGSQCGKGTPCRLRAGPSPPRPPSDQSSQAADSSSSAARRPGCLQGRGAGVHEKLAVRTPPWGAGVSEAARWWPREPRPVPGADRPPSACVHLTVAGVEESGKGVGSLTPGHPRESIWPPPHTPQRRTKLGFVGRRTHRLERLLGMT